MPPNISSDSSKKPSCVVYLTDEDFEVMDELYAILERIRKFKDPQKAIEGLRLYRQLVRLLIPKIV